jgi:hypothetical protein
MHEALGAASENPITTRACVRMADSKNTNEAVSLVSLLVRSKCFEGCNPVGERFFPFSSADGARRRER